MYRVLYRKWRPQVFSDVVGQPQVTLTLASQIRENRLAHAYLFTGSRGTGKTTCAKILSKAVNCLHPVNGDPCNECEICRGIDNGTVLDIVEIDAASNRGIDDIRLLRDEANFLPSQAKYRVYIIDEVHMLTIEAFNALLKTLEEPPEHVKFILATTEVHKLPSTILSRCQRFDFRRIEPKLIAERLINVANAEGAKLDDEAAMLIARISDGGMRDALSLLDRAISVNNDVTTDVVSASAGLMGREYIYDLIRAIGAKDTAKSLVILDELHNASCDTERLCSELSNQFRNFLIIKTVEHPENLIVCTSAELEEMKKLSEDFTSEQVLYALNILTATTDAVKRTQNRRIEAEMAIIRLCSPETNNDVTALTARISALEQEIKMLKENGIRVTDTKPVVAERPVKQPEPPVKEEVKQTEEIPEDDLPFGPDAGELSEEEINSRVTDDFAGFGSEPEKPSFNDRFSAIEDDDVIDDKFMSQYGRDTSDNSSAPRANAVPADIEGKIDERKWVRVILETEKRSAQMRALLTNSYAYINGNTLYVHPASPFARAIANEAVLQENLLPAVKELLGREYSIKYSDK